MKKIREELMDKLESDLACLSLKHETIMKSHKKNYINENIDKFFFYFILQPFLIIF